MAGTQNVPEFLAVFESITQQQRSFRFPAITLKSVLRVLKIGVLVLAGPYIIVAALILGLGLLMNPAAILALGLYLMHKGE